MRRPDIPVLTALRFPAAFAIVLYHVLVYTPCPHWIWDGFGAGVSFFYVLSGFILYYNHSTLANPRSFWMARFARIWPVHIATLALIFLVLPFENLEGHASWEITLPANILLLHAWLPFQGSTLSYNGVSWSLSVEAFFYACFPWLLVWLQRRGPALLLIASFLVGLAVIGTAQAVWPAHAQFVGPFNPACRVFEFILGMAACRHWLSQNSVSAHAPGWTGREILAVLISLGFVVALPVIITAMGLNNPLTAWLDIEVCALSFAGLIWVYAHQLGTISRMLSHRFLRWLGEVSFALYMCHQIVERVMNPAFMPDAWLAVRWFAEYFIVTMLLSAFIFHLVETPARIWILSRYRRWRDGTSPPDNGNLLRT